MADSIDCVWQRLVQQGPLCGAISLSMLTNSVFPDAKPLLPNDFCSLRDGSEVYRFTCNR